MNEHHHKYFSVDTAFCNYYVKMKREPMISSVVKISWNWSFSNFRELVLILPEQPPAVFYKKNFLKNFAIFTRKHLFQSLLSCSYIKKEALTQGCFCDLCKIFKNTFFSEHLWVTAFIFQQLLALYFAIIYSWQLSSSEKSLVGEKFIHISQGFYRFIYLFFIFCSFSFTNASLPCQLHKAYAALSALNHFSGSETSNHNDFDQLWKFKFHFEHFSRNIRFLSFDGPSNYLHLFQNHRQTF